MEKKPEKRYEKRRTPSLIPDLFIIFTRDKSVFESV